MKEFAKEGSNEALALFDLRFFKAGDGFLEELEVVDGSTVPHREEDVLVVAVMQDVGVGFVDHDCVLYISGHIEEPSPHSHQF